MYGHGLSDIVGSLCGGVNKTIQPCSKLREIARRFQGWRASAQPLLHLVAAHRLGVEALEPLLQPLGVLFVGHEVDGLGVVDDAILDEDRRLRPQRQRDGVARPGVDRDRLPVHEQVDERVERVLSQVGDDDLLDVRLEVADDVLQQVVRHRPRRRHVLHLQGDGVGLEDADPDREHTLTVLVAQDDDRHVRDGIHHQPLDGHFDLHDAPVADRGQSPGADARTASALRLFGFASVTRTMIMRPIQSGSPAKFTTVLPLVRPDSSQSRRRLRDSTSTLLLAADRLTIELALNVLLQRLQRHDAPRLLLLGHVVRHPLQRERVRPRRILEREHAVVPDGRVRATACRRSRRAVSPGNPTIISVESAMSGMALAEARRRARGTPRACTAGASRRARASSRTAPAGGGAGTPSGASRIASIMRGVTCRGWGLANRIRSRPSISLRRSSSAAKSHDGSSGAW